MAMAVKSISLCSLKTDSSSVAATAIQIQQSVMLRISFSLMFSGRCWIVTKSAKSSRSLISSIQAESRDLRSLSEKATCSFAVKRFLKEPAFVINARAIMGIACVKGISGSTILIKASSAFVSF